MEELEPAIPARGVGTGSSGNPSHTLGGSDVPIGIVNVLIGRLLWNANDKRSFNVVRVLGIRSVGLKKLRYESESTEVIYLGRMIAAKDFGNLLRIGRCTALYAVAALKQDLLVIGLID